MPAPATSLEDEIVLSTTDEVLDALGMALSLPAELDSLPPLAEQPNRFAARDFRDSVEELPEDYMQSVEMAGTRTARSKISEAHQCHA